MYSWPLRRVVLFLVFIACSSAPVLAADSFEPNDTPEQAHVLTSGQAIESWISVVGDEDWYRFEHTSTGDIQILLSSLPADYDLAVYVPPDFVTPVAESFNEGTLDEIITGQDIGASEFYVKVYPYLDANSPTDSYFLRADFSGGGGGNTAPQVTVGSPNGGESYPAGSNQILTYTATDAEQPGSLSIDIELSTDGGATWGPLALGTGNTGSFQWTVPNVATLQARVRVTANDGQLTGSDTSNGNFTITTAPTGSNELAITDGTGASGSTVTVQVTLENDDTIKSMQTDLLFDPAVLRLTGFEASGRAASLDDSSAVVFDGCVRVVLYSIGSAVITPGTGTIAQIEFELIGSGGTSSDVTPSATVMSDQNGQAVNVTTSPGEITVTGGPAPPAVTVVLPNGGESFQAGSSQNVTWNASGGAGPLTISIDLSTNGGSTFSNVTSGLSNSGSFSWTVPSSPTTQGRIRVTASDGQTQASDTSDGNFTITVATPPSVTVLSPNGGESLPAGSLHNVTWNASGGAGPLTLSIDVSTNGGSTFSSVTSGLSNSGSFSWSVPNTPTTQGRIRVTASDGQTQANDVSDGNFSITAAPGGNVVSIGSATGESGTTVSVPLQLSNEALVKALQLDISFDAASVAFQGVVVTARGAVMQDSLRVFTGRARVVLFARNNESISIGSGPVANLSFQLLGSAGQTQLTPSNLVLSDPNAQVLTATGQPGVLTITGGGGGGDEPRLDIAALQNPGRTRSLQIFVSVERGSGSVPTLTVGGSTVPLTPVSAGLFQATYFAAQTASSVTITASDTTSEGTGTDQLTVTF